MHHGLYLVITGRALQPMFNSGDPYDGQPFTPTYLYVVSQTCFSTGMIVAQNYTSGLSIASFPIFQSGKNIIMVWEHLDGDPESIGLFRFIPSSIEQTGGLAKVVFQVSLQ
jgi:hypothetical protein